MGCLICREVFCVCGQAGRSMPGATMFAGQPPARVWGVSRNRSLNRWLLACRPEASVVRRLPFVTAASIKPHMAWWASSPDGRAHDGAGGGSASALAHDYRRQCRARVDAELVVDARQVTLDRFLAE